MKLVFTGDVNFRNKESITSEEAKQAMQEVMPYFNAADFRIVNLECPLGDINKYEPIKKCGPNLISPESCICFLDESRVSGATLANNHIGDYGEDPVKNTMELLDDHSIKHCGAGKNLNEAYGAMHFEKDGIKVSVLSICENEFGIADFDKYGSAGFMLGRTVAAIEREKEISDFVIVVFHGGAEECPIPTPNTVERYRLICDMGADAVVAGHTHCMQPCEYYKGKPIIYSMGNFLFASSSVRDKKDPWFYGYMVNLAVNKGEQIKYELIPYRADTEVTKISVFGGEEKAKVLAYLDGLTECIRDEKEHRSYFMGWSYHKIGNLDNHFAGSPFDGEGRALACKSKSLFNCEVHHEVALCNFNTIINGEKELANEYWTKVQELMKMPV